MIPQQDSPNSPQENLHHHEEESSRLTSMMFGLEKQVRILQSRHDELWKDHTALKVQVESIWQSLNCSIGPQAAEQPSSKVRDSLGSGNLEEIETVISDTKGGLVEGIPGDSPANTIDSDAIQDSPIPADLVLDTIRSDHLADEKVTCDVSTRNQSNVSNENFIARRCDETDPQTQNSPEQESVLQRLDEKAGDKWCGDPSQEAQRSPRRESPAPGSSVRRLLRSPRIVQKPRSSLWDGALQAVSQQVSLDSPESAQNQQQEHVTPPAQKATESAESTPSESPEFSRSGRRRHETAPARDLYELAKPLFQQDGHCPDKLHALRNVQQFLSVSQEPPNSWSGPETPLSMAVSFGQTDLVRLLLRSRANANEKGDKGVTPLHSATFEGNLELCRLLLVARADVNMCDQHEQSPLFFSPSVDVAKLLVARAADVRKRNGKGQSALHLAGRAGFREVLKWFVANNDTALVELRDLHGMTALQYLNLERKRINPLVSAPSLQLEQKRGENASKGPHSPLRASRDTLTALNQLGRKSARESDASSSEKGQKAAKQLQSRRENEKLLALYTKAARNAEATLEAEAKSRRSIGTSGESNTSASSPLGDSHLSSENFMENTHDHPRVDHLEAHELGHIISDLEISAVECGDSGRRQEAEKDPDSAEKEGDNGFGKAVASREPEDDTEEAMEERRRRCDDERMQSKMSARRQLMEDGGLDVADDAEDRSVERQAQERSNDDPTKQT